jgi:hypothetical protein
MAWRLPSLLRCGLSCATRPSVTAVRPLWSLPRVRWLATTAATPPPASTPPPVYRVCLTGGPCAGKSSALASIRERLTGLGFRVYTVPEAATLYINGGVAFASIRSPAEMKAAQVGMRLQMALEESFVAAARASGRPSVVVCDRGLMDNRAYLSEEQWSALLRQEQWSVGQLRERYELVVHLVTAAFGAEKFYTLVRYGSTNTASHVLPPLPRR